MTWIAGTLGALCAGAGCGDAGSTRANTGKDAGAKAKDGGAKAKDGGPKAKDGGGATKLDPFSFFVTSLRALQRTSQSESGFGGDLRFGETGEGAGLRGADKICAAIAEVSMPGSSAKQWRAFLSASKDENGNAPVNAIERVGSGPWYDRLGRVVALTQDDLAQTRPGNADPAIVDDLPNEDGVPNHAPDPTAGEVDNHDTLTGSTKTGLYYGNLRSTCQDWTSSVGTDGAPQVGHSWPRNGFPGFPGGDGGFPPGFPGGNGGFPPGFPGGDGGFPAGFPFSGPDGGPPAFLGEGGLADMNSWASALTEAGCAPGVSIIEMGPPNPSNPTVGSGGGYGGFYCFALTP